MATTILFTCSDCGEMFTEPVQAFVDAEQNEITAPMLCQECGHGDDDQPPYQPNHDDSDPDYR